MSRPHKKSKGTIVADEGVKREYLKIAQKEGWEIILIPPSHRSIGLSDQAVVKKYSKKIHPIFTNDKTSHKEYLLTEQELGRSGFIIHKFVKPQEENLYREKVRQFFKKYTEKHTHGVVWTIEISRAAIKKKLLIGKYNKN